MVDFNNDTTSSKPPIEIVNLIILEAWYNFRLANEFYLTKRFNNINESISSCRARLSTMFTAGTEIYRKRIDAERFKLIENICLNINFKVKYEDIIDTYQILSSILYEIGLTKIDTRPIRNRLNVEECNITDEL